jgi:hypothetical protein
MVPGGDEIFGARVGGIGDDVLVVGNAAGSSSVGASARYDGQSLRLLPTPSLDALSAVWSLDSQRAFVVGNSGTIAF